ncbi:hypothetical protein CP157_03655 (plasmid) [Paracoccus marcusii]|nr:hypothetical protein CP157_03655 [Paracoccus marcusii]
MVPKHIDIHGSTGAAPAPGHVEGACCGGQSQRVADAEALCACDSQTTRHGIPGTCVIPWRHVRWCREPELSVKSGESSASGTGDDDIARPIDKPVHPGGDGRPGTIGRIAVRHHLLMTDLQDPYSLVDRLERRACHISDDLHAVCCEIAHYSSIECRVKDFAVPQTGQGDRAAAHPLRQERVQKIINLMPVQPCRPHLCNLHPFATASIMNIGTVRPGNVHRSHGDALVTQHDRRCSPDLSAEWSDEGDAGTKGRRHSRDPNALSSCPDNDIVGAVFRGGLDRNRDQRPRRKHAQIAARSALRLFVGI